jgi:hypothetical protein
MLDIDPSKRILAHDALNHVNIFIIKPYFNDLDKSLYAV